MSFRIFDPPIHAALLVYQHESSTLIPLSEISVALQIKPNAAFRLLRPLSPQRRGGNLFFKKTEYEIWLENQRFKPAVRS